MNYLNIALFITQACFVVYFLLVWVGCWASEGGRYRWELAASYLDTDNTLIITCCILSRELYIILGLGIVNGLLLNS